MRIVSGMDRMNTTGHEAEPALSDEEVKMLLALIEASERRKINAPEPISE